MDHFEVFTEFVTVLLLMFMFWCFGHEAVDFISPEIEPTPPALEGEVLTAGPPGKPPDLYF